MSFTLSNMLYAAWSALGQTIETTATGGGTTSAVDTKLSGVFSDDDLIGGTVVVLRDAGGAGAAPEGEFGRISAYSDAAATLTLDAISSAIDVGDRIGIVKPLYTLQNMIQRANDALRNIGYVPVPDTSLTTVDNQTEYTLPVAMKRARILRVELQTILNITNNNGWVAIPNWRVTPSAPGSSATLILPQYPAGYTIRVTYLGQHAAVNAFSDVISEYIHPVLAEKMLEAEALNWLISSKGQSATSFELQRLNKALTELEQAKVLHPVLIESHYPKYAVFTEGWNPIPPIGTVRL